MAIQEQPQSTKKKSKKSVKPTPTPGKATATALKKKAGPSKRMLIFAGCAVASIILVSLIIFCSQRKETTTGTLLQKAVPSSSPGPSTAGRPAAASPELLKATDINRLPSIQAIRLQPPQPTRTDSLKAEVVTAFPDSSRMTYTYEWKVNDHIIAGKTGDMLNLSTFKKGDLVSVVVTPYAGDMAGYPMRSPFVVVHGTTPSLDLKTGRQAKKAGEAFDFQLTSLHPDSDHVTFSLEAPMVPGMSIDNLSGKITWIIQPNQRGTISFGAAVEDTDKTKVKKTFEITLE
jgi:hypothetical protein